MDFDINESLTLPVLPLRGLVVFPKSLIHFDVGRSKSVSAVSKAMKGNRLIFLTAQKNAEDGDPKPSGLYETGVIAKVVQVLKQSENSTGVVIEGQCRAGLVTACEGDKCLMATVLPCDEDVDDIPVTPYETALMRSVRAEFEKYLEVAPRVPADIVFRVALCKRAGELADFITANIFLDYRLKQTVLETVEGTDRLNAVLDILVNENFILQIEDEISHRAHTRVDENQRDYFLREQKRAIEEELGEDESPEEEAEYYLRRIEKLIDDEKSAEILYKECRKLSKMPYGSQEASVIRTYLDTVLDLPWKKSSKDKIVIPRVRRALDRSHYGLEKVKKRIIEQLAVRVLSEKQKGQIICLAGPPGVGKTSIAQSVAKAIGRKSERIALGGVHDEAEIRGHRKTYIGSMPGRIITALQHAGTNNPLLILDEIDKLASDYKGDPTSALLEVLDIEQNNKFVDHFIEVPFDLSNVMFITTANNVSEIPAPLRDRMEIIEIESYTREEKFHIAKKHLVPKQLEQCGFTSKELKFTQKALYALIDFYTREAGVRELERTIANVMRKCAVEKLTEDVQTFKIDENEVERLLGNKKYIPDTLPDCDEVGVVNGLAWTAVGGEILPIEVAVMDGTGKLELTGSLGDVMQESAKTAVTCIRSHAAALGIDADFYKTKDIHIHAPEGAVPKDGPSAGITMATALYSALSQKPVRRDVAMTGEITLRGRVLPIGGLKEKSIAAYKNGITTVIIPKKNEPDLSEIDKAVLDKVKFIPVESFFEVAAIAVKNSVRIPDDSLNKHDKTPLRRSDSVVSGTVRQ